MAVPAYHKNRMFPEASGTSMVIETPAEATAGSALYIFCVIEATGKTFSVAGGGWAKVAEGTGPQASEQWVLFELPNWNGTTTSYTVEWGGSTEPRRGSITSFTGADTANPRGATGAAKNGTAKEAEILGPTTTTSENLLAAWQVNGNGFTGTPPAGWTERGDQGSGPQVISKNEGVAAGAQSAVKTTLNNSAEYTTIMIAIQPPQAGAPATGLGMIV